MTGIGRPAWGRLTTAFAPWVDLSVAAVALGTSVLALWAGPALPAPLRVSFALLFVVFLPGYAVGHAMLPRIRGGADRITVTLGLGLVVSCVVGLILHVFQFGLSGTTWILGLGSVTALGLVGAAFRRGARPPIPASRVQAQDRRWAASAFGAAVLVAVLALSLRTFGDAVPATDFTQLWLRPEVQRGMTQLHIGVANHESADQTYKLVVMLDRTLVDTRVFTLGDGEAWRDSIAVDPDVAARVEAQLYRLPNASTPYRRVSASLPGP